MCEKHYLEDGLCQIGHEILHVAPFLVVVLIGVGLVGSIQTVKFAIAVVII